MAKNIKHSPLKFIGGAIKAIGAWSQKDEYQEEQQKSQEEYDRMRKQYMG